jgi:hypoxanthine phosphoribosyltransferase
MSENRKINMSVKEMAEIISQSGCHNIQDAIVAIEKGGFRIADLSEEILLKISIKSWVELNLRPV